MSEIVLAQAKAKATKARLETVLQETQKDEAKLKKVLEMRRLKRRLQARKTKQK